MITPENAQNHVADARKMVDALPVEGFLPQQAVLFEFSGVEMSQGNNKQPRPKIRGSQFVKREEKIKPKLIPRPSWIPKLPFPKPQKPSGPAGN